MSGSTSRVINVTVIALKVLAFTAVLKPVLIRHASKVVTVYEQTFSAAGSAHPKSYTYFSGFHVLNFSDVRWGLAIGVFLYLAALAIQHVASGRLSAPPASQGPQAS